MGKDRAQEAEADYSIYGGTGMWSAHDDYLLKNAAECSATLDEIISLVRFSNPFTKDEVLERWQEMLYVDSISE